MQNLMVRALSGLVFAIIMIGGILWNQYSYLAVMLLVLLGTCREYFIITSEKRGSGPFFSGQGVMMFLFTVAFLLSFLLMSPPVRNLPQGGMFSMLFQAIMMQRDSNISFSAIVPMVLFGLFIIELFTGNENPFSNLGWNVLAVIWIVVPVMLTNKIYFEHGGLFLVALFGIIWFYDSACYSFGSLFGKRPLFLRISPKKTLEGFAAGSVTTVVASAFLPLIPGLEVLKQGEWIALTVVIIFSATFGDLVESMLKRSLNIKDSGSIMPGHGGFLDRFDAYFFSVPFVVFALWVMGQVRGLQLLIDYVS